MNHPKRVFRNPDKLAQARRMQEEQREAFITLHGSDLLVVPGARVRPTLMALYRYVYEQAGSENGPWAEPQLPALPAEWTTAESVGLIYDSEDGLGFYVDFAAIQKLLSRPRFSSDRDGETLLRKYKPDWYVEPPLPRVMPRSPELSQRLRNTD